MTNPLDQDVLIVDASSAGLSTAEALRRGGHIGRLTLLDDEPHAPYDRHPLSKQFRSRAWSRDRINLRPAEVLGRGKTIRLENRTNATEQAIAVARDVLGESGPYMPVPSFWTDQYAVKIQIHGLIPPGPRTEIVDGDPADERFLALAYNDDRLGNAKTSTPTPPTTRGPSHDDGARSGLTCAPARLQQPPPHPLDHIKQVGNCAHTSQEIHHVPH